MVQHSSAGFPAYQVCIRSLPLPRWRDKDSPAFQVLFKDCLVQCMLHSSGTSAWTLPGGRKCSALSHVHLLSFHARLCCKARNSTCLNCFESRTHHMLSRMHCIRFLQSNCQRKVNSVFTMHHSSFTFLPCTAVCVSQLPYCTTESLTSSMGLL